jgi:hypothetical protein
MYPKNTGQSPEQATGSTFFSWPLEKKRTFFDACYHINSRGYYFVDIAFGLSEIKSSIL